VTEPIEWKLTAWGRTPIDYGEDTGYNLVWLPDPNDPTKQILTLPMTLANEGHPAFLMTLDMGRGPEPDEIIACWTNFQLTVDVVTYAVSLTQGFVLTRDPHDMSSDRIEVSEGFGSNLAKLPEHHGARSFSDEFRHYQTYVGVDLTPYRYASVRISAQSSAVNSAGTYQNPYMKVDRDYGSFGYKRRTPVYA
jgi:hypothetical protein